MVYFTSDLHLGHRAIISMQNRPFDSLEEMDRVILSNFNAAVHRNDTVYILGDICHHMKVDAANEMISGLNGKKYLLIGNHDKKYDPALFCEIRDFMTISVNGQRFALMHYPMLSWPHKSGGAIHLHGHIHAREDYNLKNLMEGVRRYDVGVDANGFLPVSAQQIISFFDGSASVDCRTGMTLREYKVKKLQDLEFAKAYAEIQSEINEIRHSIDSEKSGK